MHGISPKDSECHQAILTHIMIDMYGIDFETLNDPDRIAGLLQGAARAATLRPLAEPKVYRYPGQGLTAFLPIRESHLAVHTYPEHGYASADIVSCAVADQAQRARDFMVEELSAEHYESRQLSRGFPRRTGGLARARASAAAETAHPRRGSPRAVR